MSNENRTVTEQYVPGWRDFRKMSEEELIVDYYTHNHKALVQLFRLYQEQFTPEKEQGS